LDVNIDEEFMKETKNAKKKIESGLKEILNKQTKNIEDKYKNFIIVEKKYYDFIAFRVYENYRKELNIVYLFTLKNRMLAGLSNDKIKNVLFKIYSDRMNSEYVRKFLGNKINSSIESLLIDIDIRNSKDNRFSGFDFFNINFEENVKKIVENNSGNFIQELESELLGTPKHIKDKNEIDVIKFKKELRGCVGI